MTSRFAKDPYSVSFQEVDSRVSASLKAEADLKKKTEKLQKELQTSLLAHYREKIELHDFLADLRGPLGPRVGRTRKHSLGQRRGRGDGSRKPNSEPGRRLSEPINPVDHFPAFTLRDPFAWVGDDGESDGSSDDATVFSGKKVSGIVPDLIPKVGATPEEKRPGKTRTISVSKFSESGQSPGRLPLIKTSSSKKVPPDSSGLPSVLSSDRCPAINSDTIGKSNSAAGEDKNTDEDRPRLTISTLANLQTGSSDIRKRIQKWCENITVELLPFADSEKLLNTEPSEGNHGRGDGRPIENGANPPKITVTDTNALQEIEDVPTNNNKTSRGVMNHSLVKSTFFPRDTAKDFPSTPSIPYKDACASTRTNPLTPGSPQKSSKPPSSHQGSSQIPAGRAQRKLSTVTATDLRVISKSLQSFHACKVYRGCNSIPAGGTDSKAFEDLARAQHRLVQRQRVRAKQHGNSYDFGEKVDAQIRKRNSARWSM